MSTFDLATDEDTGEFMAPLVDEADLILPSAEFSDAALLLPDSDHTTSSSNIDTSYQAGSGSPKPELPRERILVPIPSRPLLRRDGSVPAPRQPPPPTPPSQPQAQQQQAQLTGEDSLTLQELRRLVHVGGIFSTTPEPAPYAFEYTDAASLPEELEEWFSYGIEERARVAKAQASFVGRWTRWNGNTFGAATGGEFDWVNATQTRRREFMKDVLGGLREMDLDRRLRELETLVYVVMGVWHETAGLPSNEENMVNSSESNEEEENKTGVKQDQSAKDPYEKSRCQIDWIRINTEMLLDCEGLQPILDLVKSTTERACASDSLRTEVLTMQDEAEQRETWCAMTLLYVFLEIARTCPTKSKKLELRSQFLTAKPNLLIHLGKVINDLRFDDSIKIPLVKVLLLTWKAELVMLGSLEEVEKVKEFYQEKNPARDNISKPIITASPLDYHSFRQEISSKYPSYNPPSAVFPLEPDQKSLLPLLKFNPNRPAVPQSKASEHGSSILHQPVHIATPAPSPPPSPAAGKGGKKQNYQTNQLFPFLYPPLDSSSNQLGGKGTTSLQDCLVHKKWTGTDIPLSILEASELFKSRVRTTRALSQLWEERGNFLEYERGWVDGTDNLDVDEMTLEVDKFSLDDDDGNKLEQTHQTSEKPARLHDGNVQDRLDVVEDYYRDGLPHLQSVVMVFVRTILANLTTLITQSNGQNGTHPTFVDGTQNGNTANGIDSSNPLLEQSNLSLDDLDAIRTQEITAKAASGLLLLMLKWFKVSHVLKFEYLTQLLIDANYIPIILKLLQTQEIERLVNCKTNRDDVDFFHYCRTLSRNWKGEDLQPSSHEDSTAHDTSSDDEAAPPPVIRRHRTEIDTTTLTASTETPHQALTQPLPEVDELGMPTTDLPSSPITQFSWRNFFSSINYLRILQKSCKSKAHRNLMLVTYKSAAYLKKSLRIPQRELRLYTLKLFKNQVPYCGRKWRQTNMRVITAVYLHCRPDLRDDWLLSADVDADVEMAVPMEQSLRSLTHYYNLRRYASQMGAKTDILAEQDFFMRELDRLDWSGEGFGEGMSDGGSEAQGWEISGLPMEHL